MVIAGLTICFIGLFRGIGFAWWSTTAAFGILIILAAWQSVEAVLRFGFRIHPKLLRIHATTVLALVSFGLLLSCRLRGAYPAPAAPVLDELPAIRRVLTLGAPILLRLAALFSLATVLLFETGRYHGDRSAATRVKTFSSAEADFRANDRDWNGVNDFWTGDLQGLWGIVPTNGKEPIKGEYPTIPAEPGATWGAWYSALLEDRSVSPPEAYRGRGFHRHTSKFGFLGYPDDYIGGLQSTFIVNENNTIFRRGLTGDIRASDATPPGPMKTPGYANWPSDVELSGNWSKLD